MPRERRLLAALLVVLLGLALLLPACGETATPIPTKGPEPTKAAAPASPGTTVVAATPNAAEPTKAAAGTPAAQVKTGGKLTVVMSADGTNKHYDANLMADKSAAMWWGNIYESLLGHDLGTFEIVPRLAEKFEFSADAKTLTLSLRKGVKWHNVAPVNGREFTADDVKWNIERVRDTKTAGVWTSAMKMVEKVEVVDKYTVKITLTSAYAPFVYTLAEPTMMMYPRELFDQYGEKQKEKAIGTGPFKLDSWEPDVALRMVKNADYWEKGLPRLDAVDIVVIKDSAARMAALRSGQISYMDSVSQADMEALKKTNPDLQIKEHVGNAFDLRLNAASKTNKALADSKVRRAINLLIDRDSLIKLAFQGNGIPLGYYPPTTFPAGAYRTPEQLKGQAGFKTPKDADIAEAKKLLAEAGYANGLTIESYVTTGVGFIQPANEILQPLLKQAGIEWKLKMGDYSAVGTAIMQTGEFEAAIFYATTGDCDAQLYSKYHTQSKSNILGWGSAELDKLLDAARAEPDVAKRTKMYQDIEVKLFELSDSIPLVVPNQYEVIRPEVRELTPMKGATISFFQDAYKYVWLDK